MTDEMIHALLARGFYLFPIKANQKKPPLIVEWEKSSSNDIKRIKRWQADFPNCNFGIDCGTSGLTVLDVDVKKKDGNVALAELDLEHGIPKTFTVSTPTGGRHLYTAGVAGNRVNFVPGLDARGVNGYVLAPGSRVERKFYEIIDDSPVARTPTWLLDLIGKPREVTLKEELPLEIELDLPANVQKAEEFLANRAPAVEGAGGDQHTWQTALHIRDLGVGPKKCFELMTIWNERCEPPWDFKDLELKVHNAYKYAKDRLGNSTPEGRAAEADAIFSAAPEIAAQKVADTDLGNLRPFSDLGLHRPARDWLVENWIPAGAASFTLFAGDGGTGKSLLALQLGLAIASGGYWLGLTVAKTLPVCYVSCEDDDDELDRRIFDARRSDPMGPGDRPFWATSRVGRDSVLAIEHEGRVTRGPFYPVLDQILSRLPTGPKVLILDTVADIFAGNENNRSGVNSFVKMIIGSLALKHDCTVIMLAHPPKVAGSTYSGSTAWNNAVRNRLFLKHPDPKKKTAYRVLSNEKANYSASGAEKTIMWDKGIYVSVDEAALDGEFESILIDTIREAMDANIHLSLSPQSPRYIGNQEVYDLRGNKITSDDLRRVTLDLVTMGKVQNVVGKHHGNGLYVGKENPSEE